MIPAAVERMIAARKKGAGVASNGANNMDEDENERCRRLVRTVVHVLDNVLELRYGTADHPGGEPCQLYTFGCTGQAANYQYQIRVEPDHFIVTSGSPLRIPAGQRAKVAEFVARVNYTIIMGHFDLDVRDGELRFRLVQHVATGLIENPSLIAKFFALAHRTMDMHFRAVMNLTYAGMSPEEAVRSCEERERPAGSGSGSDTTSSGIAVEQ